MSDKLQCNCIPCQWLCGNRDANQRGKPRVERNEMNIVVRLHRRSVRQARHTQTVSHSIMRPSCNAHS